MKRINLLHEFFSSKEVAHKYMDVTMQIDLEDEFESWFSEKLNDLEFAARPLVKHLAEKYHPHTMAVVESDGVKLCEGLKSIPINGYIVD